MPSVSLTNLTGTEILLQDLYAPIQPGATIVLDRPVTAWMDAPRIAELVAAGQLSFQNVYTADEIASGFTPYPGMGSSAPQADLAALGTLGTAALPDGVMVYVSSVQDIYTLDKAGSHTPDGLTVIAGATGGYWLSRQQGRWEDVQGNVSEGVAGAALTYEAFRDTLQDAVSEAQSERRAAFSLPAATCLEGGHSCSPPHSHAPCCGSSRYGSGVV